MSQPPSPCRDSPFSVFNPDGLERGYCRGDAMKISEFRLYAPAECEIEATDVCDSLDLPRLITNTGRGYLLNATATRLDCGRWELKYIFTPAAGNLRFVDVRPWWRRLWSWIDRNRKPNTFDLKENA